MNRVRIGYNSFEKNHGKIDSFGISVDGGDTDVNGAARGYEGDGGFVRITTYPNRLK